MDPLAEARAFVQEGIRAKGVTCPACEQFAKAYPRTLSSIMAYGLTQLWKLGGEDYHHVPSIPRERGETAKLVHWGLVESDPERRRGWWRVTPKGVAFLKEEIAVPRRVLLYNRQFVGWDGGDWRIKDALGTKFDYDEIMAPIGRGEPEE